MAKYRKKPIVIEAEQFTEENKDRAFNFITCNREACFDDDDIPILRIQTLEGEIIASFGDFIIKGIQDEFCLCKPDIFTAAYEPVEEEKDEQEDQSETN